MNRRWMLKGNVKNKGIAMSRNDLSSKKQQAQIASLLNALIAVAGRDFTQQADICGDNESLDALASGLNMLAEEIEASTVSCEYFDRLLHAMPNMLFIVNHAGKVTQVNPAVQSALGYSRKRLLSQDFEALFKPDIWSLLPKEMHFLARESSILQANGAEINVMLSKSAMNVEGEFIYVAQDVTAIKVAEKEKQAIAQQLQQSQKIETVGRLASGIAHDFNNLLSGILGYVELLKESDGIQQTNDSSVKKYLNIIETSALRSAELTKQLLAFSRKGNYEFKVFSLSKVIHEVKTVLYRTIDSSIQIKAYCADDLWEVHGDASQIMQVLMNLGVNARDAMPQGGELIFEASNIIPDEVFCRRHEHLKPNKSYVHIAVRDTGEGVSTKDKHRIFEPFFTTKPVGQGTGLGLSMVYGIVQAHHGDIYVYSEPGQGTSFSIYLPDASNAGLKEIKARKKAPVNVEKMAITVLVVDDEQYIRDLMAEVLKKHGATVQQAASGQEAVEILRRNAASIQLVILDVIMPKMDGYRTFEALRKINNTLPIIFCSGYAEGDRITDFRKRGHVGFVPKPFQVAQLIRAIQDTL
jgi:two-component system, cell cycle sensor histidine kinase and response regulator CckA